MSNSHLFGWQDLKEISDQISGQPLSGNYAYDFSVAVIMCIFHATLNSLPPKERSNAKNWIQEHIISPNPKRPYLRPQSNNDLDFQLHLSRVITLAELLFNLRKVPRIKYTYERIVTDPGLIEATIVELECLMILCLAKRPFRLPLRAAGKEKNPDCEVMLPSGTPAHCEIKCKLEGGQFSSSSVKNTLDHARKQLPKGECGIIFLKIPYEWTDSVETRTAFDQILYDTMRESTRISEILCYERPLILDETVSFYPLTIKEYLNHNSPHVAALEDGLISDRMKKAGDIDWLPFWPLTEEGLQQLLAVRLPTSQ